MIEDTGAEGLARNKSWRNLEELDLLNNSIGDEGALKLSKNTEWERLKLIRLKYNKLSNASFLMRYSNERYSKELIAERDSNLMKFKETEYTEWIQKMHKSFLRESSF